MALKELVPGKVGRVEDWQGDIACFTCQKCGKVFLVTPQHVGPNGEQGYRSCSECGRSVGRVEGRLESGGSASIEWPEAD